MVQALIADYTKVVVEKSKRQRGVIRASLSTHFIFTALDSTELEEVIDVMTPQSAKVGTQHQTANATPARACVVVPVRARVSSSCVH